MSLCLKSRIFLQGIKGLSELTMLKIFFNCSYLFATVLSTILRQDFIPPVTNLRTTYPVCASY